MHLLSQVGKKSKQFINCSCNTTYFSKFLADAILLLPTYVIIFYKIMNCYLSVNHHHYLSLIINAYLYSSMFINFLINSYFSTELKLKKYYIQL